MRIVRPSGYWLLAVAVLCVSMASFAQVGIVVSFAPPALPVYEQPVCPAEGYIWTPGYWAFDNEFGDYYWVPGTWVPAPEPGVFWTPPYWAWNGSEFAFYPGYWGPQVGFYGGIDYGFGYFGHGYEGGRWDNGRFYYNRAVNNINVENIHNVYETKVINERTRNYVSYNGGEGGIEARPTPEEERAIKGRHVGAVEAQTRQMEAARSNQQLRASVNHGRPPIAATPRPGEFNERGSVTAKEAGAPYHPPTRPPVPVHAKDLPPHTMPPPNLGNANLNQQYQREQQQMIERQNQEHQKLEQQQEQEHQKLEQQHADAARTQQMERQHQQQTQQMEQRHTQQQQQLQTKEQSAGHNPPGKGKN